MHVGSVGPVHPSHRPAGHTGPDQSPVLHLGLEPGRSVTAAAALDPHGPKAPQGQQGCGLVSAVHVVSAAKLGQGWGSLAQLAQAVEAVDSAPETNLERCLPGLRRSLQISATICRGEKGEIEFRTKVREQGQKEVTEAW